MLEAWKEQSRLVAVIEPRYAFQSSKTEGLGRKEWVCSKDQGTELEGFKHPESSSPLSKPRRTHKRLVSDGENARRATSWLHVLGALISHLRGVCGHYPRIVGCVIMNMWCFLVLLSFKSSCFRNIFMLPTGVICQSCVSWRTQLYQAWIRCILLIWRCMIRKSRLYFTVSRKQMFHQSAVFVRWEWRLPRSRRIFLDISFLLCFLHLYRESLWGLSQNS